MFWSVPVSETFPVLAQDMDRQWFLIKLPNGLQVCVWQDAVPYINTDNIPVVM
jgi:hypothetical protein